MTGHSDSTPSDDEVRAFANTYGYSLDEARRWLAANGPDHRYHHGRSELPEGAR